MRKFIRSLCAAGVLTAVVFTPVVAPSGTAENSSNQAAACEGRENKQLAAQASRVEHPAPNKWIYHFDNMQPTGRVSADGYAELVPGSYDQTQFHLDNFTAPASPWWDGPSGRSYRYKVEMAIGHEYSYPDCDGPDKFYFTSTTWCQRRRDSDGAIANDNPCNYDVRGTLQYLGAGIWRTPFGWRRFFATRNFTPCTGIGDDHTFADNTGVRTVIWVRVRFYLWPDFPSSPTHLSQPRWGSTKTLYVINFLHFVEDNDLYPGLRFQDPGPGWGPEEPCG
jgi:hypothetical protein